ncbi:MAG: hypothetical protein ABI391_04105 [Hyphomicrobiaceae bacterium]
MLFRVCASVIVATTFLSASGLAAEGLPPIKASASNVVPECVTPGRLTAFLKDRNPKLDPAFEKIAVDYMRHGEALGMRWDYAFFQMVIETGYLKFERGKGQPGLVRPQQNNFAGLGATGRGVHGESFPDVSTGVLAHLQHVLMYTGEAIPAPVAQRTQKVIEWKVLDDWRAGIKGPMTYGDLALKWANNKSYADDIATHAEIFAQRYCNTPDPAPELVAEARPGRHDPAQTLAAAPDTDSKSAMRTSKRPAVSGRELAQRAIEDAQARGDDRRSSLGGTGLGALATESDRSVTAPGAPGTAMETASIGPLPRSDALTPAARDSEPETIASPLMQAASVVGSILRSIAQPPAPPVSQARITPPAPPAKITPPTAPETITPVALQTKIAPPAPPAKAIKCRVWTASYGGTKAILIKAPTAEGVSYTVLDVNDGAEKREAAAYISAYARGGQIESTFGNQTQALEKAFELCPEG